MLAATLFLGIGGLNLTNVYPDFRIIPSFATVFER